MNTSQYLSLSTGIKANEMSLLKSGLPCDNCGSSDALSEYDNGTYCFSCKNWTRIVPSLEKLLGNTDNLTTAEPLVGVREIPNDVTKAMPWNVLKWLRQYGITDDEIHRNDISWSGTHQWLIFPIYGDDAEDTIIAWEARNFATAGPKTLFFGNKKDLLHIVSYEKLSIEKTIVIVEDVISAIKVGRCYPCLCLFGSSMDKLFLSRLKRLLGAWGEGEPHLTFWLDQDKLNDSMKYAAAAIMAGFDAAIVHTISDPKFYDATRIRATVQGVLDS